MNNTSNRGAYVLFITWVAALGGLLFGYDTAVISGTVKYLKLNFITPCGFEESIANSMQGFLISSALIGCIMGGLSAGILSAKLGRKKSLFFAALLFILSAIGSAFPEMGMGKSLPELIPIFVLYRIIGGIGVGIASMVLAILTVDNFACKPLMIIGSLGMAASMLALGTFFYVDKLGLGALIVMMTYTAAFALSWGPVCWVLLAEIFPNRIRSAAMAIAVAAQWIANYTVSWTFPMMNDSTFLTEKFNHGFAYWVYAAMGILSAIFVWKLIPETKGKSLEEMNILFKKK